MTAASSLPETSATAVAPDQIDTSTEPVPPTDTPRIVGDLAGRLLLSARWQQ